MENIIDWQVYYATIVSVSTRYAKTKLNNSRVIDVDDLIQEGVLTLCACMAGFEKERYEPDMQEQAFSHFFNRALKRKLMTLNFKAQKYTCANIDEINVACDNSYVHEHLDLAESVQRAAGSIGAKYLALCLDPPIGVQQELVARSSTFRDQASEVLQISGRKCSVISRTIESCILGTQK